MREPALPVALAEAPPHPAEVLAHEVAILAGRLAQLLTDAPIAGVDPVAAAITFLRAYAQPAAGARPLSERFADGSARPDAHPLHRVAAAFTLAPVEIDLLLLAGMAEEHEGFASLFRALHPRGEPRPTTGLAAQLFCASARDRLVLRELLTTGAAVRSGALVLGDDGPFSERNLLIAEALWPALAGVDAWPAALQPLAAIGSTAGLGDWLGSAALAPARDALRAHSTALLLVVADDETTALHRALALACHAQVPTVALAAPSAARENGERLAVLHAVARGVVPVVRIAPNTEGAPAELPTFRDAPCPVIVCAREATVAVRGVRPVVTVRAERLSARARTLLWSEMLPELPGAAPSLGARYSLEPHVVAEVVADVRARAAIERRAINAVDVAECVRARANLSLTSGVRIIHPTACWDRLILPEDRRRQLSEALDRLMHQSRVLDDWGFLAGRPGARGVRMLFAGPPGTGKTLAAEVLAHTLHADLLAVDLARVVSKWIGETEKNLADVFDAAERTQAVLLFDEADALFGKRTEVTDAHDRYANLETAYLLSRLERFEGLVILSTNLRENIDAAFTRRLEFVVEFDEPSLNEREALWRCHLPEGAPLADDVHLAELASLYPIVGGLIRNATVAAGFLASAADAQITRTDLVRAVRREYDKSGRAFPGAPAGAFITA
jgi:ATPase family associated with various cellular activities (AAA)